MNKLGLGVLLLCGRSHCGDLGVFQGHTGLAIEDGAAVWEWGCLVGLLGQLALGVGLGQRAAVFDQLQEVTGFLTLGLDAGGASAEGGEFPCLAGLHSGASGRGEAHAGEVPKDIGGDEAPEGLGPFSGGSILLVFCCGQRHGQDSHRQTQEELHGRSWR